MLIFKFVLRITYLQDIRSRNYHNDGAPKSSPMSISFTILCYTARISVYIDYSYTDK